MKVELEREERSDYPEEPARQTIVVARWVVYFQGALLGVVAATFFVFGMMVGSLTQSSSNEENRLDCRVSGRVVFSGTNGDRPDSGAVVLLLPRDHAPEKRLDGQSIRPASFQPLGNSVLDYVHGVGGAVVRTDDRGEFEVFVEAPATFYLLVISRKQAKSAERSLVKSEMVAIGSYFSPVEGLLGDREYFLETRYIDKAEVDLGTVSL